MKWRLNPVGSEEAAEHIGMQLAAASTSDALFARLIGRGVASLGKFLWGGACCKVKLGYRVASQ